MRLHPYQDDAMNTGGRRRDDGPARKKSRHDHSLL